MAAALHFTLSTRLHCEDMKWAAFLLSILALLVVPGPSQAADTRVAWPQFGFDDQHSGVTPLETTITAANVHSLKPLYRVSLVNPSSPSTADGSPAFLADVNTSGAKDLLFLSTKDGWILALDAATGKQVWGKQYLPATCQIIAGNLQGTPCYTTSSPVLDPGRQYVYGYGLDGYVHKLGVTDGTELHDTHWPELVTTKPALEKGSSALSLATDRGGNSYLYAAASGYLGDAGDYQGHLTAINLSTGVQHVFNTLCSDQTDVHFVVKPGTPGCGATQSAIWSRPGVIHDPVNDLIYIATGNGTFDPARHDWGDSVLALNADGTGSNGMPLDSYTPAEQATLDRTDADLGSTAPALLPSNPTSPYPHLAVMGQKINRQTGAGELRLINRDNLSQSPTRGPGHTGGDVGGRYKLPQGGFLMTQPTVWANPADPSKPWVFISSEGGIVGLQVYTGSGSTIPTFHQAWKPVSGGRTSPIVANGVLYYLGKDGMEALRATDGVELWTDTKTVQTHWESPIVANGRLYVPDDIGHLVAYALTAGSTPAVKFSIRRSGKRVDLHWTVSSAMAVRRFQLYDSQAPVGHGVIRLHRSKTYTHHLAWPAKKPVTGLSLRVLLKDGRQFTVFAR